MKKYVVLTICFLSFATHASQRAVTDEGDIVILNSNGTWEYENPNAIEKSEIKINEVAFTKSADSTFPVKSTITKSKFWIDPDEWTFEKKEETSQAEYQFQRKGKDIYGMVITEKIEIGLANLSQLALENAREVAPDIKMLTNEYRIVNGNKVMYMEMEGTVAGITFTYLGYYYSDSSGSTQYLTYTGSKLVSQYKNDIEKFLNGFSIQQ